MLACSDAGQENGENTFTGVTEADVFFIGILSNVYMNYRKGEKNVSGNSNNSCFE